MNRRVYISLVAICSVLAVGCLAPIAQADQLVYNCGEDICLINPANPAERSDLTNTAGSTENAPVWSPLGGLIAFRAEYQRPGNQTSDIFTLDPAAPSEATEISKSADRGEGEPHFSPDGSRLVFISGSSSDSLREQIEVAPADGSSNPVAVGSSTAEENHPTWSADGSTIAFNRLGSEAIWLAPSSGGTSASQLANARGYEPVWSPDGRFIAAARLNQYPYGVVINDADGTGNHELSRPLDLGSSIAWSCDSRLVTYVADEEPNADQVRVAPADGSSAGVQIPMPTGWIVPHHPRFSPDGTLVAFDARRSSGPGNEQLLVAPADGSAVATPIIQAGEYDSEAEWRPTGVCGSGAPPSQAPPGGTSSGEGSAGAVGIGSAVTAQGGTGGSTGQPGAGASPGPTRTQVPVKVKLAYFNHPVIRGGFMGAAGIDCNVPGGHPTGVVAEICAASGSAYTRGAAPQTGLSLATARSKPKPALFATGSVRVPAGGKKTLELKITAAGRKLLQHAGSLKLTLKVVTRNGSAKPVTTVRTVTVEAPSKHS